METAVRGDRKSDSLLFPPLIVCLFQSCSSYCKLQESQNIPFFFYFLIFTASSHTVTDFLSFFFTLWPGGVQCIRGTVRNWASLGQVNYMCDELIPISETFDRLYCGKLFSKLKFVCERVHHFCQPINHVLTGHRGYFSCTLFDSERQRLYPILFSTALFYCHCVNLANEDVACTRIFSKSTLNAESDSAILRAQVATTCRKVGTSNSKFLKKIFFTCEEFFTS